MAANPKIAESLQLVEKILTRQKSEGLETIAISRESLALLSSLPQMMRKGSPVETKPVAAPAPLVEQVPVKDMPRVESEAVKQENAHSYGDLAVGTERRGRVEIIFPAGDSVRDKLNNLYRIARDCEACRKLGTLWEGIVFAKGNPEADLMFIGDAPGAEDEKQKKPFVGPAGKKLDQIIGAMGLKPEDVYISNIVKFRPRIGDGRFQGPKNRMPTPEEMSVSVKIIRSEIEVIKPRAIVILGATAAEGLLETGGSLSGMRGKFHDLDGIPVLVTNPPSLLLREDDPERARQDKRKVWEDFLLVMEKLNMPISEKQRGFFL